MGDIDNRVGISIHTINMGMKRIIDAHMKTAGYDEVTMMHGWVLKYLYENRDREVYQKDIEKRFGIGRSTVTTILQLMEKRDLIYRESVERDARLKRVVLTEKGYKHHDLSEEYITRVHTKVMENISEEEKETFLRIAAKIEQNISNCRSCIGEGISRQSKMKEDGSVC